MNIEEILNRLERIDHKEYSGGFEFADSSTFDEMGRCFEERKILAKEIERLNKENERYRIAINEMAINISRAIEYIEENKRTYENDEYCFDDMIDEVTPLLNILKGSDKE